MLVALLRVIRPIAEISDRITRVIIGVMLAVIVCVLFYEVGARYIFYRPTQWSDQLARFLFIWMTMLGVALCSRHNEHLKLSLFEWSDSVLLKRTLMLIERLTALGLFAFIGWMAWQTLPMAGRQLAMGLGVSWIWAYSAIPVGSALVVLYSIEKILEDLSGQGAEPAGPASAAADGR